MARSCWNVTSTTEKKSGKCLEYYPNGKVKKETHWVDNLLHGDAMYFDSLGSLIAEQEYFNGELNGISKHYKNGKLAQLFHYKSDSINGEFIEFYENGKVAAIGTFENGLEKGIFYYYQEDSMLISKKEYVILDSISYLNQFWFYDSDGLVIRERSNFLTITKNSDILEIELSASYFDYSENKGRSQLVIGLSGSDFRNFQINDKYELVEDSISLDIRSLLEYDTLRGYVEDRSQLNPKSQTFEQRKIYFEIPLRNYRGNST